MNNQPILLQFHENLVIPFEEHWGWIDFLSFSIQTNTHDILGVLCTLLDHKNYHYGYISPYTSGDEGSIHGPFRLDTLHPSDFLMVSWEDFQAAVKRWVAHPRYSKPSKENLSVLNSFLDTIDRSTSTIYKLEKSREGTEHEFGWILRDFEEFVVIDFQVRRVIVAVFGDD